MTDIFVHLFLILIKNTNVCFGSYNEIEWTRFELKWKLFFAALALKYLFIEFFNTKNEVIHLLTVTKDFPD